MSKFSYGATVEAEAYKDGLQAHAYIPQSDQAILEIIKEQAKTTRPFDVLDLGCGPARLTPSIGRLKNVRVNGIDASKEFIDYAQTQDTQNHYLHTDFLKMQNQKKYDCVLMQGVFHHIHDTERRQWIQNIYRILKSHGVMIIGDEFIPPYKNEKDRIIKAGLFYLHIISEALLGKFNRLAYEEVLNFFADTQTGLTTAGYYDEGLIKTVYETAEKTNRMLIDRNIPMSEIYNFVQNFITYTQKCSQILLNKRNQKQIDRGDKKISITSLIEEIGDLFKLEEQRTVGPVETIGGMAVLSFKKRTN